MKHSLSRLLALLVSLSLLIGFSATANAEAVQGYQIRQDIYAISLSANHVYAEAFETFTPNDGEETRSSYTLTDKSYNSFALYDIAYRSAWNFLFPGDMPFKLNKENRVTLENFYYRYLIHESDGSMHYVQGIGEHETVYVVLEYTDGTSDTITPNAIVDSDNSIDVNFNVTPNKNVSRFTLFVDSAMAGHVTSTVGRVTIEGYCGEWRGDNKHDFIVEIQSEEAGLLSGILGWIQNIFNKIGDMFAKVSEIANSILQLPTKLWAQISQGLKDLFIPSQEDMENFSGNMDRLLENKLGAVYEVSNILTESWDRIQASDESDTIEFPSATIPLPDDNEFTFGGYQVQIVPEGFSIVSTAVKTITGIVCTVACINGLRKRYDEIMGG